jgi:hypothetical protein
MSFILDALKKAEEARHPAGASSLGRVRVPRLAPHRARWPWMVGGAVLLALNMSAIAYLLWPRDADMVTSAPGDRPDAVAAPPPAVSARLPEANLPSRPQGPPRQPARHPAAGGAPPAPVARRPQSRPSPQARRRPPQWRARTCGNGRRGAGARDTSSGAPGPAVATFAPRPPGLEPAHDGPHNSSAASSARRQ